jgi:uncharacterized membrane protein YkvA (DUF1232 family)
VGRVCGDVAAILTDRVAVQAASSKAAALCSWWDKVEQGEIRTMPQTPITLSASEYSGGRFWAKLAAFGRAAGRELVEKALWLYYAAERPDTPQWARATVYGALAYFILPADAVPDLLPAAGYTDDLAVIAFAVATLGACIDSGVRERTAKTLARWFGD